jgi:Fe-S oxidoreductase
VISLERKTLEEFLKKLSQLTQEYGISINGCGCCGSPYLEVGEEIVAENLAWNKEEGKYVVEAT